MESFFRSVAFCTAEHMYMTAHSIIIRENKF